MKNLLYPNVTTIPGKGGIGSTDRLPRKEEGAPGEFGRVFDKAMEQTGREAPLAPGRPGHNEVGHPDLGHVKPPLKFSAHAAQRLQDRRIALDPGTMTKVNEAVDKAEAKGIEDTLVLTKDAALIVNVKNRTVITAMDRSSLNGNVFTNIDGAVIV